MSTLLREHPVPSVTRVHVQSVTRHSVTQAHTVVEMKALSEGYILVLIWRFYLQNSLSYDRLNIRLLGLLLLLGGFLGFLGLRGVSFHVSSEFLYSYV